MEKIKEREGGRRRKGGRCLKHRSIKIRLSQILLPFSSLGSIDERGDDARATLTTTATTTRQIRDYAASFFFFFPPLLFFPSPLVALPSSLPCASFARISFFFFLPLSFLSFFFFRKKTSPSTPRPVLSKGWPDFIHHLGVHRAAQPRSKKR